MVSQPGVVDSSGVQIPKQRFTERQLVFLTIGIYLFVYILVGTVNDNCEKQSCMLYCWLNI